MTPLVVQQVTLIATNTQKEEHSRDITLLIDLISYTTPGCFSTFYLCAMVPTLVENTNYFCVLVC